MARPLVFRDIRVRDFPDGLWRKKPVAAGLFSRACLEVAAITKYQYCRRANMTNKENLAIVFDDILHVDYRIGRYGHKVFYNTHRVLRR